MATQLLEWPTIESVIAGYKAVLLYGPPATGKTTAAESVGIPAGKSVFSITLTDETPAAELRGFTLPGSGKWIDGPATELWSNGGRLVVDEIDHASGDCLDFVQAIADMRDGHTGLVMPNETRERKMRHESYSIVATMNGNLEDLPPAIRSRFAVAVYVGTPHPAAIASLPEDLQNVARDMIADPLDPRPVDMRAWKAYAALRGSVGAETAAAAIFADKAAEILETLRLASAR